MLSTRAIRAAKIGTKSLASTQITRKFGYSALLWHKETGTDHDVEEQKHDSLNKHTQGKGHWKPELASDSEEAVKADREWSEQNEKTKPPKE